MCEGVPKYLMGFQNVFQQLFDNYKSGIAMTELKVPWVEYGTIFMQL